MENIIKQAETGMVVRGEGGIACGRCKSACPWEAPQFYDVNYAAYSPGDDQRPRMTKRHLCIDRIQQRRKPACLYQAGGFRG